jgi:tripartite-type tricarboxylate transporter receptor subunit TctC
MTGTRMVHVPYRGGAPALTDLLGQQVQVYFSNIANAIVDCINASTSEW